MNPENYTEGIGMTMHVQNGSTFDIVSVGIHNHFATRQDELCSVRYGIIVIILGIGITIGWFREYN